MALYTEQPATDVLFYNGTSWVSVSTDKVLMHNGTGFINANTDKIRYFDQPNNRFLYKQNSIFLINTNDYPFELSAIYLENIGHTQTISFSASPDADVINTFKAPWLNVTINNATNTIQISSNSFMDGRGSAVTFQCANGAPDFTFDVIQGIGDPF
jgi:hypothetical protein